MTIRIRINFGIPYNMGGRASNGSGFSLTRRLRDREKGEWEGAVEGWLADISSAMRNNKDERLHSTQASRGWCKGESV